MSPPLNRFLPKLLTWPERQYFWERFVSVEYSQNNLDAVSNFLAGRWAAKEACRKACEHLGSSNGFHSIMILPVASSDHRPDEITTRPRGLILRERLRERMEDGLEPSETQRHSHPAQFDINSVDGQLCEVSISHDSDWATAVAIVPVVDEWRSGLRKETARDSPGT
ncbi:hypothetical protein K458DRAFT_388842 [Lentithecium fluviatile CBS 122367]|uniref:Uncharacterized protein n=1 Tax=Lentithecium fluviatile CBS 122367 TaxID=1168545 RepID=A0A6G1J2B7_9PLEO|nr:hypothetical protein K458DRAFT_388842 [Lentithecium fluviatile CBS 122367]